VEVAKLIAEGLSNKRIGARLFISEATVATHVRNIMNKLGFNSRAQIAGWVVSQER
jgi:DNA-binding NarL/FixJ family response regulator